jgi:hypothetical protein
VKQSPSLAARTTDAAVSVSEDGRLKGWCLCPDGRPSQFDPISIAGDDLQFWFPEAKETDAEPEFNKRFRQAFGAYTASLLARLSIAVVGCSGTGSVVVEQLARSGVGRLVLVDPDRVETKNLNRIVNTTVEDAKRSRHKVEVAADAVTRMSLGTIVEAIPHNLMTTKAVRRVAECDILFGCVDGAEGRLLMNKLASFYSIPYIDVEVRLDADGKGSQPGLRHGSLPTAGWVQSLEPWCNYDEGRRGGGPTPCCRRGEIPSRAADQRLTRSSCPTTLDEGHHVGVLDAKTGPFA